MLDILQNFRGQDPLKKLFWTELNYDKANSPISRRGWSESTSSVLTDDPVLFATAGNAFHVIHSRLKANRPLMGMERPVVSRLLQDHPYALFIFSNAEQDQWHFLNVKYDNDVQKRRLFRRITVGPNEKLRTASERLAKLDLADAPNVNPNTIQTLHDEGFDVEPVTKEFFCEYGRIFDDVETTIRGIRNSDHKHLFTQRLFNRLMFLAFIQKKGWLRFDGNTDYLDALWESYRTEKIVANRNFYRDRLKPLFFIGLNGGSYDFNGGRSLKSLIGDVPYLNGGLFDYDDDDKDERIVVPDTSIGVVLSDLFARFNFTVTESTPLDVEVAVDPEMLGKIFEELVTGRHETGSYYTPKPIVSFMCREAVKGYLAAQLNSESRAAIEEFVDEHKASTLKAPQTVVDALRRVKVCDPACGSGAYLMGMLHELLDLRACLSATAKLDGKSVYERKLEIIQNNLYGVDLDQFAVNIARLRLWLSLSVDFEGDTPPPLPNLDYKVEAGDSVCSPNPSGGLELGFRKQLIDDYLKVKATYMTAHHGQKLDLRNRVAALRADIASWSHRDGREFDWPVEFAEVFVESGFDIVLANPPYVRQELIRDIKPQLAKVYPAVYTGTSDLYCYFYARGIELLRPGGMFVFISSNKWLRANYGARLRASMRNQCAISSITDFGELPVFEAAATFPMIIVAQCGGNGQVVRFTQVKSLDPPYPEVKQIISTSGIDVPLASLDGSDWKLTTPQKTVRFAAMRKSGVTLEKYLQGKIFRGVLTGCNEAFVIDTEQRDELIGKDPKTREIIKRLAVGDDVRRWRTNFRDRWLIFSRRGIDIKRYSSVLAHLAKWRKNLEPRPTDWPTQKDWLGRKPGSYKWYEIQDDIAFFESFGKPKILYPEIAKEPRFAFDETGAFTNNKVFCMPTSDLYLLGVLNSTSAWEYAKTICAVLGDEDKGGRVMLQWVNFRHLPVPNASKSDRTAIASLVEQCLDKKGKSCEKYEAEIDDRVANLFGLKSVTAIKAGS